MTPGGRVRLRRIELGLTQEELAIRMGNKSRASVSTIENDRDDLTTTRIRKLAAALECTPAYIMGWSDEAQPNKSSTPDNNYYFDDESARYAQFLFDNPEYKVLFDANMKVKPEDIGFVEQMINRVTKGNS